MARLRKYGESLLYAETHRHRIPELWKRNGHRVDSADRDWTEYAHGCREPLVLIEEYRDRGHNLRDKNSSMTRRMAERSHVPAYLVGWQTERPVEVDQRIAELQREALALELQYPITKITARRIWPKPTDFHVMEADDWWLHVCAHHADHYGRCERCQRRVSPIHRQGLDDYKQRSPLWTPVQMPLLGAA